MRGILHRWFAAALAAASTSLASPEGGLRIATWNVENLDADAPAWRVNEIADELARLDADLVFLQEVASGRAARRLREELARRGAAGYEVYSVDSPQNDQEVVLLSRVRPTRFRAFDFQGMGARLDRAVWADLALAGGRLRCVAVHLKAGVQDGGDARRRNDQVRQLARELVRPALADGTRVVLLGDLNDVDPEVRYANGRDPDRLSEVFDILRREAPQLRNTDADLPLRERVSHESGWMFDHVVADARLAGLVHVGRRSRAGGRAPSDHAPIHLDLAPLRALPLRADLSPERDVPGGGLAWDELDATLAGTVHGEVAVRAVVTHSRLEDLELRLLHASQVVRLPLPRDPRGRTLDIRVVTRDLAGAPAAGAWRLEVRDRGSGRGGTLRSWALRAAAVDDPTPASRR